MIVLNHTLYFRDSRSVADSFLTSVGYLSKAYFKNFDWLLPLYLNIIIGTYDRQLALYVFDPQASEISPGVIVYSEILFMDDERPYVCVVAVV